MPLAIRLSFFSTEARRYHHYPCMAIRLIGLSLSHITTRVIGGGGSLVIMILWLTSLRDMVLKTLFSRRPWERTYGTGTTKISKYGEATAQRLESTAWRQPSRFPDQTMM